MDKCVSKEIAEYVYEVKLGGETIVYAPILGVSKRIGLGVEDVRRIVPVDELSSRSLALVEKCDAKILRTVKSPCDMDNIVILPNHKCNFSCSYCYAAKGRSKEELDIGTLGVVLDWFLDKDRIPKNDLYIFIVGGGEPTMSWGVIEEIVRRVSEARKTRRRKIAVAMTTNGSLITEEKAMFLAASDIMVNVSFEVIREVQNQQRGPSEDVEHGIELLQKAGARFAIRATVSPLSVDRMPEMVDIVLRKFPRVRRLNLEAILAGKKVFDSAGSLRSFLARFKLGLAEAKRKGGDSGLKVMSAACLDMTILKDRFCKGDLCLTPRGEITICRRISSPNENAFPQAVFGRVEKGQLRFDETDYQRALKFSLDDRNLCRQCFLRWHCGGLCISQQTMFPRDYYDVLCDVMREEGFGNLKSRIDGQGVPAHLEQ